MTESTYFQDRPEDFTAQFNSAIESIGRYNSEHTGAAAIGKAMGGLLGILMEPGPTDTAPTQLSPQEEAAMTRDLVKILQTDDIEAMGLKLFDGNPDHDIDLQAENIDGLPGRIELILSDSDAFSETIGKLKPTTEEDVLQTGKNLDSILQTSAVMVFEGFGKSAQDEEKDKFELVAQRQLDLFAEVVPSLVKGGYAELPSVKKLIEYHARLQSGELRDFIRATKMGLNNTEKTFGPSMWQGDSTPGQLQDRWMRAIDFLRELQQTGSPYFVEIFNKVRDDYDKAFEYVLALPPEKNFSWEHRQVMHHVGKRWSRQFALENSFYLAERTENDLPIIDYDPSTDPEPAKPPKREIPKEDRWWENQ